MVKLVSDGYDVVLDAIVLLCSVSRSKKKRDIAILNRHMSL